MESNQKKIRRPFKLTIVVICVVLAFFVGTAPALGLPLNWNTVYGWFGLAPARKTASPYSIHFLNVGEGDSTLVFGDGQTILIDSGPAESSAKLKKELNLYGVEKIDIYLVTHLHADHIGGSQMLLKNFSVGQIICSDTPPDEDNAEMYADIMQTAMVKDCKVTEIKTDTELVLGKMTFNLFLPNVNSENDNEKCMVTRICYGDFSAMIMGDAGSIEEAALINGGYNLSANILRVGHHGSKKSTTDQLLNAASPRFAVISVGTNSYGHPNAEVYQRLENHSVQSFRTDLNEEVYANFTDQCIEMFADTQAK